MKMRHLVAAGLIALGLVSLLAAPLAQSCVTDGDTTACETAGVIILNVLGVCVVAAGAIVLVIASAKGRRRAP